MATTSKTKSQPIPQNTIGECFAWRDWFQKISNITFNLGTMSTQNIGVSGTFKSGDTPTPKTVTVVNGIITSIV